VADQTSLSLYQPSCSARLESIVSDVLFDELLQSDGELGTSEVERSFEPDCLLFELYAVLRVEPVGELNGGVCILAEVRFPRHTWVLVVERLIEGMTFEVLW
jgi:hypothetical protein